MNEGYSLSSDPALLNLETVHAWLTQSYWSPGISLETVKWAAANLSLVVGSYFEGKQIGYLRVVSDKATFAWVCDVWVDERHRGKGLAKDMMMFALEHPEHQQLRRWLLATKDAHEIYRRCGFEPLPVPERWMVRVPG